MALSSDRNTPSVIGALRHFPIAASALIYAGALVCLDASGNAVKGAADLGLRGIGRAEERVDNSGGSAGDANARIVDNMAHYLIEGPRTFDATIDVRPSEHTHLSANTAVNIGAERGSVDIGNRSILRRTLCVHCLERKERL